MVLFFINEYQMNNSFPDNLIDNNVRTDYRKIRQIAFQFEDKETVKNIIRGKELNSILVERFPLAEMFKEKENFVSLLFYLGMLTIKGSSRNKITFGIPNYVVQIIYWEYFLSFIRESFNLNVQELEDCLVAMQNHGNPAPFGNYLEKIFQKLSNRDLMNFDEKYLKAVMMSMISFDGLYYLQNEQETENGYIDILLTKNIRYADEIRYEWALELKYLKTSEKKHLTEVIATATKQLKNYASSEFVQSKWGGGNLKKAVFVLIGKDKVVTQIVE